MHESFGSSTAKLSSLVTQEEMMVWVKLQRSPVIQCVAMEKSDNLSNKKGQNRADADWQGQPKMLV